MTSINLSSNNFNLYPMYCGQNFAVIREYLYYRSIDHRNELRA